MHHEFELSSGILTSDNYRVALKGFTTSTDTIEDHVLDSAIKQSCKKYIREISLMDALHLVEADKAAELIEPINSQLDDHSINSIEIRTIDAIELSEDINVDLDPSLTKQKKKGFFGKLKERIFG